MSEVEFERPETDEEIPFDERFAALEHQAYLMYLQLNAVTQLLVEKDVVKKEEIGKLMDSMHTEITGAVEKLQSEAGATPEA